MTYLQDHTLNQKFSSGMCGNSPTHYYDQFIPRFPTPFLVAKATLEIGVSVSHFSIIIISQQAFQEFIESAYDRWTYRHPSLKLALKARKSSQPPHLPQL